MGFLQHVGLIVVEKLVDKKVQWEGFGLRRQRM